VRTFCVHIFIKKSFMSRIKKIASVVRIAQEAILTKVLFESTLEVYY